MTHLDVALANARNGWPGFPVQADKTPYHGFTNWEHRATIDQASLRRLWDRYPDALPAVAPGVARRTVIDVDRKPGKPNGFESLAQQGLDLDALASFSAPSVSGLGTHYWFSGRATSVNHVLPGVDRKSGGGYVVVPYLLPPAQRISNPAPKLLLGGKVGTSSAAEAAFTGNTQKWLERYTTGRTLTAEVTRAVQPYIAGRSFTGHEAMLRFQIHLVKLATEGHNGVPEALDFARDVWLASPHTSAEDPALEWDVALDRAIKKYGGTRR